MLTLPVEAGRAAANRPARILVIGRSETVLSEHAEAALSGGTTGPAAVTYDAQSRSIGISLDGPQDVTVTAWWATSFVPLERKAPLWDCGPGNCRWPPPGNTPSPTPPSRLASPSTPTSAPASAPRSAGPGSGVVLASLPRARRGPAG
jgi:hypothetical protein